MMFHASSPPFSNLHLYLTHLCKGLKHLNICWQPVVTPCPAGNMTNLIDNILTMHQLLCDIDHTGPANFTEIWSTAFVKDEKCQKAIQYFNFLSLRNSKLLAVPDIISDTLSCMTESLQHVLQNTSLAPTPTTALFKHLLSRMHALLDVVEGKVPLGVNMELLAKGC